MPSQHCPAHPCIASGSDLATALQCSKLVEDFGLLHLSAGDLLRAHMKSGTPDGNMVAEMIAQGQIVPSRVSFWPAFRAAHPRACTFCELQVSCSSVSASSPPEDAGCPNESLLFREGHISPAMWRRHPTTA